MSSYGFENLVRVMQQWGFVSFLLPFLLIFIVVFAILQKTKILGDKNKRLNASFSLVFSLFVVIPSVLGWYPASMDPVRLLAEALPQISIILIAIVMLLLIIGIFGGDAVWGSSSLSGWVAILAAIVVLWVFGAAAGWWVEWSWFTIAFGEDAVAIVIMLLIFAIIIWYVTKDDSKEKAAFGISKIGDEVSKLFGGKK